MADAALAQTTGTWLAPFLSGRTRLSEITAADLGNALDAVLPYDLKRRLDADVPTHFEAPTGQRHPIRYDGATPGLRLPPQAIGAQTRDILLEVGLSDAEIDALIASGAVAQTSNMRG